MPAICGENSVHRGRLPEVKCAKLWPSTDGGKNKERDCQKGEVKLIAVARRKLSSSDFAT